MPKKPSTNKKPSIAYRVYVAQVNQTYVTVTASDKYEAREKGYAKWKREEAHSSVMSVEEI